MGRLQNGTQFFKVINTNITAIVNHENIQMISCIGKTGIQQLSFGKIKQLLHRHWLNLVGWYQAIEQFIGGRTEKTMTKVTYCEGPSPQTK